MSTLKADHWVNPDGTENYKCRAWASFKGDGVVAIRASGNITSITDNGVGDYTLNFTTALADALYAVSGNIGSASAGLPGHAMSIYTATTTSVRVATGYVTSVSVYYDYDVLSVHVFR